MGERTTVISKNRATVKGLLPVQFSEMGAFSVLGLEDESHADKLNLLHPAALIDLMENQIPEAIVFSKGRREFNMAWQVP